MALCPYRNPLTEATACFESISNAYRYMNPGSSGLQSCGMPAAEPAYGRSAPGLAACCHTGSRVAAWVQTHVILAMPPSMRQALISVQHGVLLRYALIEPPEETSLPGPLKAVQVSLVKPVVYLKDEVTGAACCRAANDGAERHQ